MRKKGEDMEHGLYPMYRIIKRAGLILLSVIIIAGVAWGTVTVLTKTVSDKQAKTDAKTPEQQAADLAKQANNAATDSANAGKTDDALTHYKEALAQYQKAGDKAGEAGVQLQIQYYEKVKANEEKAKAAQAPAAVTP